MLGQLTRLLILSIILSISLTGHSQSVVDSLRSRLAKATNLSDSIVLLFNIYDASPDDQQGQALESLYNLAIRRANYTTAIDVLKQMSRLYSTDDSIQHTLLARAKNLPDIPGKEATIVYLNIRLASNFVKSLPKEQQESKLREYLSQHAKSEQYPTYQRIEYLFQLCEALQLSTHGEMLTKYFRELQTLIDNLPPDDLTLRYLFYTRAAENYLSNNMIPEAVAANKSLLKVIGDLEQYYASKGLTSRNFDKAKFMGYRRLLRCHDALTSDEVDDYYSKILPLIERNPSFQSLSGQQKKPTIYHLMAKKRYAEAIPLIKEQLNDTVNTDEEQFYLVEALLKAAEAIGDKNDLQQALDMSNALLKTRIEKAATDSYEELQIVYDVNELRQTNDELMLTNQEIQISRQKAQLTYAITSIVVLLILLAVLFTLYRRSRKLTRNLSKSNDLITNERDALQHAQAELIGARDKAKIAHRVKSDFINNMGHEIRTPLQSIVEYSGLIADCIDPESNGPVKRYADVISLNTDLLITLVNDVLDLPSLENAKARFHFAKTSVQQICMVAIDNVALHIKPGIELIFANDGKPDSIITTDPNRVEQILLNLLTNAAKYTNEGSIVLEYAVSPKRNKIEFTVTDTGIGIPKDREEAIFSLNGNDSDPNHGNSLGLYISRLLANMLGGNLSLDRNYHAGAKFILSIPIS